MPRHPAGHVAPRRTRQRFLGAGLLALALAAAPLLPAAAAPLPPAATPALPATVSADALPTVQVDGVVWAQVVVGGTVYATGSFANARPAGAAPGTRQTPRANLIAFDLATGVMNTSWAPSLNAQGLAITASPDGRRIYVGGDFTAANGQPRDHVVALDAATGTMLADTPGVNSRVRAIVATGDTVYVGGDFTVADGRPRTRLAAFAAADGTLSAWAPTADREIFGAVAPAGAGTLVVGGRFSVLSGAKAYGLGALDLTTGEVRPFAAGAVVRNAGDDAAIYDLSSDGSRVYGTGYVFGPGGNLENAFAADARTGELAWVNGCRGDTYSSVPVGDVLYAVGHPHDCSMVGANPEVRPRAWQRAQAMTAGPSPTGRTNTSGAFSGRTAPEMLGWIPTVALGTYTGQYQGAWSIAAGGDHLVVGGEFPRVNGTAQQGLVRFAARTIAPNRSGPDGYPELAPTLVSPVPGRVSATTRAAWDRDDPSLTYELLRGSGAGQVVVATQQASSAWWDRPRLALADTSAPAGTQTYRVRATDPSGNALTSAAATVEVVAAPAPPPGGARSPYEQAVEADAPLHWWRLGEPAGTKAVDRAGGATATLDPSAQRGVPGATGDGDRATYLPGTSLVPGVAAPAEPGPQAFSAELWLRTTTARGGKVLGFGDSATGPSDDYDRQLWMGADGRVHLGVNGGGLRVLDSPAALNDGAWHHVVGTMGPAGTALFVDGVQVAADALATRAQPFTGRWRLGGDRLRGWPSRPPSDSFAGDLDDVAIYPAPLPAARVAAHAAAAAPVAPPAVAPPVVPVPVVPVPPVVPPVDPPDAPPVVPLPPVVPPAPPLVPVPPVGPPVLAGDAFERTVTRGLGAADVGGAWTLRGPSSAFSVSRGAGRVTVGPGLSRTATLDGPRAPAVDVSATLTVDRPVDGGTYAALVGRRTGPADDYRLKLRHLPRGAVAVSLVRRVGGSETELAGASLPEGTAGPGTPLAVRLLVTGDGPVRLRASVARSGAPTPATWSLQAEDSTPALAGPGGVGVWTYLTGGAPADQPVTLSVDDLMVRAPADGAADTP